MLFKSLPSFIARRNGSALLRASHVCRKGRPLDFRTCRQRPVTSYVFKYQGEPSRINFFSRRLIMTANTRTIDCIKFGIDGQYTREDIKVIDLLRMTNLHARDLIPLERGSGLGRTASIQPRKNSIVLSVSHLRSIITHDSLYVLEPESFAVKQFVQEFSSSLKSNEHTGDNFEIIALEGLLSNVATKYSRRVACFGPMISSLLDELRNTDTPLNNSNAGAAILTRILPIRNTLSHYERSSEGLLRVLERLLNDDEDMSLMMLTDRKNEGLKGQTTFDVERHEPIELILEAYYHKTEECVQSAFGLRKNIEATQELVNIALDDSRNRLIQTNVHMAIITVGLAFCTMVYGVFGMNLVSGLEEHPQMFKIVSLGAGGMGGLVYFAVLRFMTGQTLELRSPLEPRRKTRLANRMIRQDAIKRVRNLVPAKRRKEDGNISNIETRPLDDVNEALLTYLEEKGGASAQLDRDSMVAILTKTTSGVPTNQDLKLIFAAFDNNGDGFLDYDDVVNFVASQYESN